MKNEMMLKKQLLMGGILLLAVACKPDPDFKASGCNENLDSLGIMGLYNLTKPETANLNGLNCVAYSVKGNELKIDLINVWASCTNEYNGFITDEKARFGSVDLKDGNCDDDAACMCLYNFSFTLDNVDAGADFAMNYDQVNCDGSDWHSYSALLPLAEQKEGVVCRYLPYDDFGDFYKRCDPNYSGDEPDKKCTGGKLCTKADLDGQQEYLCLLPCSENNDCKTPFSCVDQFCQLEYQISSK